MRVWLAWLVLAVLLSGCRAGSAQAELEQLRARVSTLEAENAHLSGQLGLLESEREQLRQQVSNLGVELAKAQAGGGGAVDPAVMAGQYLVVMPREARAGQWVAVHVRNYPLRLLNQAGIALRAEGGGEVNLVHIPRLASANVFLLSIPPRTPPGTYRVVLGEAGPLGPGAKLDDQVAIRVQSTP
ncbi:MAG: bZIP transcription factor [Bacillota bacterium]